MAGNNTEISSAVCPFTGTIVEVGNKIPGKPDNFRTCLSECVLQKINNMSAGVDLKNKVGEGTPSISRCTIAERINDDKEIQKLVTIEGVFCR